MKRLNAPKFWPIQKKTKKFVVEPKPGPHRKKRCLTIGLVIRDVLGHAQNMAEARKILLSGIVKIDGKKRNEEGFPVGLMDVIEVGNEHFRVMPGGKGLCIRKISEGESKIKLLEIKNKKIISGKKVQLNLHDGSNIIYAGKCKTGDVIIYDIEKGEVKDILSMDKGANIVITNGLNTGKTGIIEKIVITKGSQINYAVVNIDGKSKLIPKKYAFVVGREKPVIEI